MATHNHSTSAVKEYGECPACDVIRLKNDEFVMAPHVTKLSRDENGLHEDAVTPACDFCLDSRIVWEYPANTFWLDTTTYPFGFEGAWLACERCAAFIENNDPDGLSERSFKGWLARGGENLSVLRDDSKLIQQGFFKHRTGPRIPYTEGEQA